MLQKAASFCDDTAYRDNIFLEDVGLQYTVLVWLSSITGYGDIMEIGVCAFFTESKFNGGKGVNGKASEVWQFIPRRQAK